MNITYSQEKAIKITNPTSKREILIKENKRIRIITNDGQRISGTFKVMSEQHILIKNRSIALAQIVKIKRNPLLISIITTGFFMYYGATAIGASIFGYLFTGNSAFFLFAPPGGGMIWGGIKSPNLLKGYKKNRQWVYEIIKVSK